MKSNKPTPLKPKPDNIPQALRKTSSWVLWRYVQRGGKWTKPPLQVNGKAAKSNDPNTWAIYTAASAVVEKFDGFGLVLVDDLVGVDLDHVLDRETGEVEAWANDVLQHFKRCYVERSPGGDGIRIFCRGVAPRCGKGGPANRLELYDKTSPRYLTVTGHKIGSGDVVEAQAALDWLDKKLMTKDTAEAPTTPSSTSSSTLTDEQVIERARSAKNGAKFSRLWSGDPGEDASSADAALVGILSFWTQDFDQLDRLFRRSGLMRPKWDEKRGQTTYGARTIAAVLNKGGEHYSGPSKADSSKATGEDVWPQLDPLPELTEPTPRPFPFDGLGPTMGTAAKDIAEAVQAPDAIAAGSVLAAASLATQPHHDVVLPHGLRAPLSVFVVTSAHSSDRKSSVDGVACRPVAHKREQARRAYAAAKRRYLQEMRGRKRGDAEPEEPVETSLTVSKSTTEGLLRLLKSQPHVGIFSSDGAEVFGGHSLREERRSAGIAFYCKGWGGEPLDSITSGDGVSVLIGRRLCMHTLIQPVVLRQLMADPAADGQGLLGRCLIAQPDSLAGSRLFPELMVPALERDSVKVLHERLTTLLDAAMPMQGDDEPHELKPTPLKLSRDARALWIELYNELERQQAAGQPLEAVRPWAGKAAEHAARIAGVIAAVEGHSEVTIDDMMSAAKVVDFYLGEHVRLMGASVEDRHLRRLSTLRAWMVEQRQPLRHADILQRAPRPVRDLKAEGVNKLLDELQRRGYIRRRGDSWEVRP